MHRVFITAAILLLLVWPAYAHSQEECTVGVASGRATVDGRPLLWKNRDTWRRYSNNTVQRIEGEKHAFLALVTEETMAWAGVNDAGFAIINAASRDLAGPMKKGPGNGQFQRLALGECADIAEFRALLNRTNATGRQTNTSYGVIDAKGGASIFETKNNSYLEYDACDAKATPDGWIVRSNFALSGDGVSGGGYERCARATRLWSAAAEAGRLDHRTILRIAARDLSDPSGTPFVLPTPQHDESLPPYSIETYSTINRYSTAACTVFHGVKPDEDPGLMTMWTIIGDPIFCIATPLWMAAGELPAEVAKPGGSPIRDQSVILKDLLYTTLFRRGKARHYLDTRPMLLVLSELYATEDEIFSRTADFLEQAHSDRGDVTTQVASFQKNMAGKSLEGVKRVAERQLAQAPLRVGVYGCAGSDPRRVTEALAALRIDAEVEALPITAADVTAGVLQGLEAVLFTGADDGTVLTLDLGRKGVDAVRRFARDGGGGIVGLGPDLHGLADGGELIELAATETKTPGLVRVVLRPPGLELFPEFAKRDAVFCRSLEEPSGQDAMLRGEVGDGRLILCELRPEVTPGMRWMLPRMVRWVARRTLPSYSSAVVRPDLYGEEILFDEKAKETMKTLLADLSSDEANTRTAAFDALIAMNAPDLGALATGRLRDDSIELRRKAARHLVTAEYAAGVRDLQAAIAAEQNRKRKKPLEKALADLQKMERREQPVQRWFVPPSEPMATLAGGVPRQFEASANDTSTLPAACGYHVYRIDVPAGTERLTLNLHGLAGESNLDLFLRPGEFAFRHGPGAVAAKNDESRSETITVDNPAAGAWYAGVECSSLVTATTEDWAWPSRDGKGPFAGVSYEICALMPPLVCRSRDEGYYKSVFMDSGVRLTMRRDLPAADYLGLTMEYIAVPNKGATAADTELQNRLLGGDAHDENGVLLYPDGAPRFRCVFVNGGSATNHGASLSEQAKERIRAFVRAGGSFAASCAGAFISSMAYDDKPTRKEYLHLWPGCTRKTNLLKTFTGHTVPAGSPLLTYSDFGGDSYIADVYHNGGCFTDPETERFWAEGTEVLLRYDYPSRPMHEKVSCWARKENERTGRVVVIGSHPESVTFGEQLELQQAILRYAMDGNGMPRIKATLESGQARKMDDNSVTGHERIGDLQYHHFLIDVPQGSEELRVRVSPAEAGGELGLYARHKGFAFGGAVDVVEAAAAESMQRSLSIDDPKPGRWYVAVKGLTTVVAQKRAWGWEYCDRLTLLDGLPYEIEVEILPDAP